MRIGLKEAAGLLGKDPDALRRQLVDGKAALPPGTRVTRRGQGKSVRWYLEFWPQTLADLRKTKAMGSDAAKGGDPPAAAAQPEVAKGPEQGQNNDAKGGKQDGSRKPRWWW